MGAVKGRSGGGEKKKERKKEKQTKTNKHALCKATVIHSSRIRPERSGSARKQRIALYGCHCEAFRAHPEIGRSTSVHIL